MERVMSVLCDTDIYDYIAKDLIAIDPFDKDNIQPASYDLTLDSDIILYPVGYAERDRVNGILTTIAQSIKNIVYVSDTGSRDYINCIESLANQIIDEVKKPKLKGPFQLLSTNEKITLPDHIQGSVYGRSSLARKGVFVHLSAGFIDPGFSGTITLECINCSDEPIVLVKNDRIAQIAFYTLKNPAKNPYNGRYQNQIGATESKFKHGKE